MPNFDAFELKYDEPKQLWLSTCPGRDCDLAVAGSASGPDLGALELATLALEQFEPLTEKAIRYVLAFVDPAKSELRGEPSVVSLECGFSDRVVRVALNYESDLYGLWWTDFRLENVIGFAEFSFGRKSW